MFRKLGFMFGMGLSAVAPALLHAQDTLLAGFTFSQFLGSGAPTINGDTFETVDFIVATYRGNTIPDRDLVDGSIIVNSGGAGYDNPRFAVWSYAGFDINDGVSVSAESFGLVNTTNSLTVNGIQMFETDSAGMGLTFNTQNTLWEIEVKNTDGFVNANTDDFTFAARGNGGTATVEWLHNNVVFATTTVTAGAFNTYAHELPGAFYSTGIITGRLTSGSVTFDNVQFNGKRGTPPSFTLQPVGRTVLAGANVTFTASATSTITPTYRWYKNGVALSNGGGISGATTATLNLTGVTLESAGTYTVVASNNGVTAESDPAELVVQTAPVITRQPVSTAANPGQIVTFIVELTGFPTPSVRWQKDDVDLVEGVNGATGVNTTSLTINGVVESSAGSYRLVATNAADTTLSEIAVLTVTESAVPALIVTPPDSTVVVEGGTATFSVSVSGAPAPTIQWRFNGSDLVNGDGISGATTSQLVLTGVTPAQAGTYTVFISNSAGEDEAQASLTVQTAPAITTQPVSRNVVAGQTAVFTVTATGAPAPSYQWYKNGQMLSGQTSATLTLANVSPASEGLYSVVATNVVSSVTSIDAQLTVRVPPKITTHPTGATVAGGAPINLNVVTTGNPEPTYQWFKNGTAIPGATDPSLSIVSAKPSDAGRYSVRVQNSAGSVVSNLALVRVTQPVSSTNPAKKQVFVPGSLLSLGNTLTTPTNLRYQWFRNGTAVKGGTSSLLVIESATAAHSGTYSVTVYNSLGRPIATRSIATLSISVAGAYETLLLDPVSDEPVGRVSLDVSDRGAFTGTLLFEDGGSYRFSGDFKLAGSASQGRTTISVSRGAKPPLLLALRLDALAKEVEVEVSAKGSSLVLGEAVAAPRATSAPWAGVYKLTLAPISPASGQPRKTLNATATISKDGTMRVKGTTADGVAFDASFPASADRTYAIFLQPYGASGGHIAGELQLVKRNGVFTADDLSGGNFVWWRPRNTGPFPAGIDVELKPRLAR